MRTYDRRSFLKRAAAAYVAVGLAGPLAKMLPGSAPAAAATPDAGVIVARALPEGIRYVMKADTGWVLCDGASYSAADFPALASALSSMSQQETARTGGRLHFIFGGSRTRFRVPDLRRYQRVPWAE